MNINDIAKMAGVSRAAVSRYLNNGYVSEQKREQIRKVIKETGYTPSSQAQTLRTKKTRMIGIILPKINSQSISRMVAGISEVVEEQGYQLLLADTKNNIDEEIKYINIFRENHVDGIILIATVLTQKHEKALKSCNMPVVILGQYHQGYFSVYQDDYNAAKEISRVLLAKSRKPAFIGVINDDRAVGYSRKKGFLDAIADCRLIFDEEYATIADFSIESGYEKMKELYRKKQDIDSILCVTESIAIGAVAYLKEIGKKIPQDIRVACMGDSSIGMVFSPKLTTIHFHYKTSGMEAARILIEAIKNPTAIRKELKMSYQLVENESTE